MILLVVTLKFTTFTSVVTILTSITIFPFKLDAFFPWNIFYIFANEYGLCMGIKPKLGALSLELKV